MNKFWALDISEYDTGGFCKEPSGHIKLYGKGGGESAPTTSTVQQNTIAPEASPYYSQLLGQAAALTDINSNPWQQYQGDQVAPFSPMQSGAFSQLEGYQIPQQTTDASNGAYNISQQAGAYQNYTPQQFQNQYYSPQFQSMGIDYQSVNAPQLQDYYANAAQGQAATGNFNPYLQDFYAQAAYGQGAYGQAAQGSYNPNLQNFYTQGAYGQAAQGSYNPNLQNFYTQGAYGQAAQGSYNPNLQNYDMQAVMNDWASNPANQINNYQMGPASQVGTDKWVDPDVVSSYMSPYIREAIDPTLALMQQQSAINQRDIGDKAQQAGAFGGYRQGIQGGVQESQDLMQMGAMAGNMYNQGYGVANQAFNTDQARALQAGMANQGANLATGTQNLNSLLQSQALRTNSGLQAALANQQAGQQAGLANQAGQYNTQQLGANIGLQDYLQNLGNQQQMGLANLSNQQQANLANQAGQYNTQQLGANIGLQDYLQNLGNQQQMGLANLSNQQQANLANQAGQYNTQQLGANIGLQDYLQNLGNQQQMNLTNLGNQQQMGLANLSNQQQANLANQAGQYSTQQLGTQTGLQSYLQNLANMQQTGMANTGYQQQTNLANQQAGLGVQQLGSSQYMQGQLANQQYYQQAQQAALQQMLAGNQYNQTNAGQYAQFGATAQAADEASRQFGANLGLQGLNAELGANQQLGQLGQQQYAQQMGLNQAQQLAGAQQQSYIQQLLGTQYQNYLSQQNWPYNNLAFLSSIIGRPITNTQTSMYSAPPSTAQSVASLGLGAYGLSGLMGGGTPTGAGGGLVNTYKKGGAVNVKHYKAGGISGLPQQKLQKLATQKPSTLDSLLAQQQLQDNARLRTAAPIPPQSMLPPTGGYPLPEQTRLPEEAGGVAQLPVQGMNFADGGIIGYAHGGTTGEWGSGATGEWKTDRGGMFGGPLVESDPLTKDNLLRDNLRKLGLDTLINSGKGLLNASEDAVNLAKYLPQGLAWLAGAADRPQLTSNLSEQISDAMTSGAGLVSPAQGGPAAKPMQAKPMQAKPAGRREEEWVGDGPVGDARGALPAARLDSPNGAGGGRSVAKQEIGLKQQYAEASGAAPAPAQSTAEEPIPAAPTADELYTAQQELTERIKKDDPMYKKLQKMLKDTEGFKDSRKYRAALRASAELAKSGQPRGFLPAAARGVGAAGASVIADDTEINKRGDKAFGIEAMLGTANQKQAAGLTALAAQGSSKREDRVEARRTLSEKQKGALEIANIQGKYRLDSAEITSRARVAAASIVRAAGKEATSQARSLALMTRTLEVKRKAIAEAVQTALGITANTATPADRAAAVKAVTAQIGPPFDAAIRKAALAAGFTKDELGSITGEDFKGGPSFAAPGAGVRVVK